VRSASPLEAGRYFPARRAIYAVLAFKNETVGLFFGRSVRRWASEAKPSARVVIRFWQEPKSSMNDRATRFKK